MSTNNTHSSVSFVKNVAHQRNFLNSNLTQINLTHSNNNNNNSNSSSNKTIISSDNIMNNTSSVNSANASASTHHKSENSSPNIINASLPTSTNSNNFIARKSVAHKSLSLANTLGGNNGYNSVYSNSNINNNSSSSQPYFPSMLKSHNQSSFSNLNTNNTSNKKFSIDYHNAIRFDYSDAFLNNHNVEFLTRVSQMQRLQFETVEWERKKKLSKKKATNSRNFNSNND